MSAASYVRDRELTQLHHLVELRGDQIVVVDQPHTITLDKLTDPTTGHIIG